MQSDLKTPTLSLFWNEAWMTDQKRVQQLSENVWILRHNWQRLEPTIGMILTDEGWVAIDGGNSPLHGQKAMDAMKAIRDVPIKYVINTHRHFDHVFGNQAFDAPVIGSDRCRERFEENVQDDWGPDRALDWLKSFIFKYNDQLTEDDFPNLNLVPPSISYAGEHDLKVGGSTLHLFPLEGVHTDDGIGVYVVEEKVMFLSDAFYYQGTPEGSALKLPELLDRVAQFDVDMYAPGHERAHDAEVFNLVHRGVKHLFKEVESMMNSGTGKEEIQANISFDPDLDKRSFLNEKMHRTLIKAAIRELKMLSKSGEQNTGSFI